MIGNKWNGSKWFWLSCCGFILFAALAQGQSGSPRRGTVTAIDETVDARAYKSAPVTVYKKVGPYSLVTWDTLSHFDCDESDDIGEDGKLKFGKKSKSPVPGFITALNKAPVAAVGFMLPMDMDDKGEKTTGFILSRSQSACCYGIMPRNNEWIYVTMPKGKAADIYMDIPVTVFGTLSVGAVHDKENGSSFYRMTGDKLGYPKESVW